MSLIKSLGFIGAGNMASSIRSALFKSGVLSASQIYVSCPDKVYLKDWEREGCNVTETNKEVIEATNTVIWAIKPHHLADAVQDIGPVPRTLERESKPFHISILAGMSLLTFKNTLTTAMYDGNHDRFAVARVMPNIAVRVGSGCSVYAMGDDATEEHRQTLQGIFAKIGLCYQVPEDQINAYCALFSSGIGFMFPILEAMSDGAVKHGIPRDISVKLAAQTMKGAAELILSDSSTHPGQLKDSVCSPGGTTIAGVTQLEKFGIRNAIISAIEAATEKGNKIGRDTLLV